MKKEFITHKLVKIIAQISAVCFDKKSEIPHTCGMFLQIADRAGTTVYLYLHIFQSYVLVVGANVNIGDSTFL